MTDVPIETTAVPAVIPQAAVPATVDQPTHQNYGQGVEGLEDVDVSDLSMPQLKIIGADAEWEDTLSNERFAELDVILLGMIKQRILWPSEVGEESAAPLCKSTNYTLGIPGEAFAIKAKGDPQSPLEASGFSPEDVAAGALSCTTCELQEWGSHPKRDTPWCVEQFVFAVMLGEPDEPIGSPAILTLQRSSLKPAKAYITSFVRKREPLFVNRTTLKLNAQSRGTVHYAVPKFIKGVATDPDYHEQYAELYRDVKAYVTASREPEATPVTVTTNMAPAAAPVPVTEPVAAAPVAAAQPAMQAPAPVAPPTVAPIEAAVVATTVPVVASTEEGDVPF